MDWRENEPVHLEIGPVLHADDAVANKICALFGRAEVRDFVDAAAILASGRYTEDELLTLAADHDPGFDRSWFAEALTAINRLPDSLFQPYGLRRGRGRAQGPHERVGLKDQKHGKLDQPVAGMHVLANVIVMVQPGRHGAVRVRERKVRSSDGTGMGT